MAGIIKKLFRPKLPYTITKDGKKFKINSGVKIHLMDSLVPSSGWGNSIKWLNYDRRRIVGWKQFKPRRGEIVKALMASGKVACFHIVELKEVRDPPDMFFATLEYIAYENSEVYF